MPDNLQEVKGIQTIAEREAPQTPEDFLWQQADELYQMRTPLQQLAAETYAEVERLRSQKLNLHQTQQLQERESTYWRLQEKLAGLKMREEEIAATLEELAEGTIDPEKLKQLMPPKETPAQKSEKEKRLEKKRNELERAGFDPAESAWDLYWDEYMYLMPVFDKDNYGYNSDASRLHTGRNRRDFKGNQDPFSAVDEFFYQTTDTHGGKVAHGKDGRFYVTKGGMKVRKK